MANQSTPAPDSTQGGTRCDHGICTCRLDKLGGDPVVEREGHRFCSDGCAEGRGCDHAICECAERTA